MIDIASQNIEEEKEHEPVDNELIKTSSSESEKGNLLFSKTKYNGKIL